LTTLPVEWRKIDVLINNAGLARGLCDVSQGQISDWEEMVDTNIKGLLYVSRAIAPGMIARQRGHIINIGSIAGKEVYTNGNVYCATKHAVDALTQGMRMDWIRFGIKVSALHPGYVETEFSEVRFHEDRQRAASVYEGFKPLAPSDVADVLLYMVQAPDHVNLADVVLLCKAQASAQLTHRQA
jgi:NADP-dependent 3-hydroxy acid dehydrogenase YdfG